MILRFLILLHLLVLAPLPVSAVEPDEILSDPALEQRARDISLGLRCLVCQNQSIDDSNAPLAKDLRVLVRERLTKGDTDSQVIDFVVARYGEFVLLKPRLTSQTLLLWLGPPLLLILAVFLLYGAYKRRSIPSGNAKPKPLSASEKRELKKILKEN